MSDAETPTEGDDGSCVAPRLRQLRHSERPSGPRSRRPPTILRDRSRQSEALASGDSDEELDLGDLQGEPAPEQLDDEEPEARPQHRLPPGAVPLGAVPLPFGAAPPRLRPTPPDANGRDSRGLRPSFRPPAPAAGAPRLPLVTPGQLRGRLRRAETADAKLEAESSGTKTPDTKTAGTKTADTKTADTKTADTKTADTKTADTKTADTKASDANAEDKKILDKSTPDAKTSPAEKDAGTAASEESDSAQTPDDWPPAAKQQQQQQQKQQQQQQQQKLQQQQAAGAAVPLVTAEQLKSQLLRRAPAPGPKPARPPKPLKPSKSSESSGLSETSPAGAEVAAASPENPEAPSTTAGESQQQTAAAELRTEAPTD